MKSIFLSIVLAFCLWSHAQVADYYVYLVQGPVTLTRSGKATVSMKQKQLLFKNDVLTLPKNTTITLVNKEQQYITLKQPGVFKVSTIPAKQHTYSKGITRKYLYLLWHELLDPGYDYSKLKHKNIAASWGGVSRGEDCPSVIFPTIGTQTAEDSLVFKWRSLSPSNQYEFLLTDQVGKALLTMPVQDTQVLIKRDMLPPSTAGLRWTINAIGAACQLEPVMFDIINKAQEATLIRSIVPKEAATDLLTQLATIEKLEKSGLVIPAKKYYDQLVKDHAEDIVLRKSYIAFLLTYGFEEEGKKLWDSSLMP